MGPEITPSGNNAAAQRTGDGVRVDPPHPDLAAAQMSPTLRANLETPQAQVEPRPAATETVTFSISNGAGIVTLGDANESVVSFTMKRMAAFERALDEAYAAHNAGLISGLVLRAPTLHTTCAGADLKMLGLIQSRDVDGIRNLLLSAENITEEQKANLKLLSDETLHEVGASLSENGKKIFERVRDFPGTTVAALSGTWLGGFFELAQYCKYVVAAEPSSPLQGDGPKSSYGFPEPLLGILEGLGGTYNVTRKIGLPAALGLLMKGDMRNAGFMHKVGLIDKLVPANDLYDFVAKVARGEESVKTHKIPFMERILSNNPIGRSIVRSKALEGLKKFPADQYPAPHRILECALEASRGNYGRSAALESKRFGELLASPQAAALTHITFFGTESTKVHGRGVKLGSVNAVVNGSGTMGAGIGVILTGTGAKVTMCDEFAASLQRAQGRIEDSVLTSKKYRPADKEALLSNVGYQRGVPASMPDVNFAVEAVFEQDGPKEAALRALSAALNEKAIIASNTSSMPMEKLSQWVTHPERFIGMHYFNPPEEMRIVEIIPGPQTDPKVVAWVAALATQQGKYPIVVKDVPGFLINRMFRPYFGEALQLFLDGFPIDMIDQTMTKFGMVMGPLRTLDKVGLRTGSNVSKILEKAYPDRMPPATAVKQDGSTVLWTELADELGKDGKLNGESTGQGFYVYADEKGNRVKPAPNPLFSDPALWEGAGLKVPRKENPDTREIEERLIMGAINEAVRCLDEGVAGTNRTSAAMQIDLGSVMGVGFAPFRGGLIFHADTVGAKRVYETLTRLKERHGDRFTPWEGIRDRALSGGRFGS